MIKLNKTQRSIIKIFSIIIVLISIGALTTVRPHYLSGLIGLALAGAGLVVAYTGEEIKKPSFQINIDEKKIKRFGRIMAIVAIVLIICASLAVLLNDYMIKQETKPWTVEIKKRPPEFKKTIKLKRPLKLRKQY